MESDEDEIFTNPTVKQVIFQIRYPNLFFIESKIGDYQLRIMGKFPESSLIVQRNMMVVNSGEGETIEDISKKMGIEPSKKVWQFKNKDNTVLSVTCDSLDIVSLSHKTYNTGDGEKFRDTIKFAVDNFLDIVKLPIIGRIGLRYIDECPLPDKDNKTLLNYYNTAFPTNRFDIINAEKMDFVTSITNNGKNFIYRESLMQKDEDYKLILDFDCFDVNVNSSNYLEITDILHRIIKEEYFKTIKEPVKQYMRGKGGI